MRGSKRYKDGAWRLRVYMGTDPATGRRRYANRTVRAPDNRTGERTADRALASLVTEISSGRVPMGEGTITLAELLERWQQARRPDWSPKTIIETRATIDNHIAPALGHRPIERLRGAELGHYLTTKRATLAASTVHRQAGILHAALERAVRWDLIARNPMDQTDPVTVRRSRRKVPDVAQVGTMLVDLERRGQWRDAALFRLASLGGARRGQLAAVRWNDLDLDAQEITYRNAFAIGDDGPVEKGLKEDNIVTMGLDPRTLGVLDQWRRQSVREHLAQGLGRMSDASWMFPNTHDRRLPLNPETLSRRWAAMRGRYGMDDMVLHALRHFMGSEMTGAGEDVVTVAGRMGHARPSTTTDLYGHRVRARDHEAADRFAALVDAAGEAELA